MEKGINEFIEYCGFENEDTFTRTTSKISCENLKRLRIISEENEVITQAKAINFALNLFFDEFIDEEILKYTDEFNQIYQAYVKKEAYLTETISCLISLAKNHKKSQKEQIVKNCLSSLETANKLLDLSKIKNQRDFDTAKSYFLGNLSWFTSEKEQELKENFNKNYSLDAMQSLLEFIISDKDNIGNQKYEFALRNIEVTFSQYLSFEDSDKANTYINDNIKSIKQNAPTIFMANAQLKSDLEILSKPFSEVLKHKENGEYVGCKALDTIHIYLGGGNLELVKSVIKAYGIEEEFSNTVLDEIYYNLCNLSTRSFA